ncbi:MAG: hypothetical protein DWQ05_20295 [Calditrichaeota bacterium]|nr:MAG: hypothetical protein DWQ05_20295 [Calditrichota bacterium]
MKRRDFLKINAAGSLYYLIPGLGLTSCTKNIFDPLDTAFEPDFCSPVDLDETKGGFYVEYIQGKSYRPTDLELDSWQLTLAEEHAGAQKRSLKLNYTELMQAVDAIKNQNAFAEKSFFNTFQCVGNKPGGHLISNGYFTGIPLSTFFAHLGFDLTQANLQRLYFHCYDGYSTNHKIDRILQDEQTPIYFVTKFNGVPLSDRRDGSMKHGFPVRLVTQGMLGMKSPKGLTELILSDRDDIEGWWETRPASRARPDLNWADEPLLKINSKITSHVNYQKIKPGTDVILQGFAVGGTASVEKVEVGSAKTSSPEDITWGAAKLMDRPDSMVRPDYDDSDGLAFSQAVDDFTTGTWPAPNVWCTWTLPWRTPSRPGKYFLAVRATDTNGIVQPQSETAEEKADGENGYHVLTLQVED